jgi:alanyl-tRNA synthetase
LQQQREKSRLSLIEKQKTTQSLENIDNYSTLFTGYTSLEEDVTVLAIYIQGKQASVIKENQEGHLVFDKSPFYAESG